MTLPVNTYPIYTLTIPSTGEQFKYRPFTVREEKALLIAQQSEDYAVMLDTIKSVISSCAKTAVEVDKLASFDVEYIFLQLRAVSVGEFVDLIFPCDVCEVPEARAQVSVNLQQVVVEKFEGHTNKIALFGDTGMLMKYPSVETLKRLDKADLTNIVELTDIVVDCVDMIYNGDEVFPAKDQKRSELVEFIESLTSQQFEAVEKFIRTMPQMRAYVKYKCPVCGKEHNKYLEGLSSFF